MTIFYTIESAFAEKSKAPICNNSTIKGTYMFYISGQLLSSEDEYTPEAYAAFVSYDGRGNLILNKTSSIDGVWNERITEATYQINSDCTGLATYPTGLYFYYVDPNGESFTFVKVGNRDHPDEEFTGSPDRISGSAKRISKRNIIISPGLPVGNGAPVGGSLGNGWGLQVW
jgi:hypothetical protein